MKFNRPTPGTSSNSISALGKLIATSSSAITHAIDNKRDEIGIDNQEKKMRNEFLGYLRSYFEDNIAFNEQERDSLQQSDLYGDLSNEDKATLDELMKKCLEKNRIRSFSRDADHQKLDKKQEEKSDTYDRNLERAKKFHETMETRLTEIENLLINAEKAFHVGDFDAAMSRAFLARSALDYTHKIISFFSYNLGSTLYKIPILKKLSTPGKGYDFIMRNYNAQAKDIIDRSQKKLFDLRKAKKDVLRGRGQEDSISQEAHNTIPQGEWEEVISDSTLRGFSKDGVAYELSIENGRVTLGTDDSKKYYIVRQSHGQRKLAIMEKITKGKSKPAYPKFFNDYKLIIEEIDDQNDTSKKIEKTVLLVQDNKNERFKQILE